MSQKYKVLKVVGEGAYGVVLKCLDQVNNRVVAVKKFKDSKDDDEMIWRNTMRELKTLKKLDHPNIVGLLEAHRRKGRLIMVMEFVDQNMLQVLESLPSGQRLPQRTVISYLNQLLKALDYLHELGLIHRDIKPENLLISTENVLKLCDFGFVRDGQTNSVLTEYVATRWYRAPELLMHQPYSHPVDLWAAACIFGELTDRAPLFPGGSDIDQIYRIQLVLGTFPRHMNDILKEKGFDVPRVRKPIGLQSRYKGLLSSEALDLMRSLLQYDPKRRPTAKSCLSHPIFNNQESSRSSISKRNSTRISTDSIESEYIPRRSSTWAHQVKDLTQSQSIQQFSKRRLQRDRTSIDSLNSREVSNDNSLEKPLSRTKSETLHHQFGGMKHIQSTEQEKHQWASRTLPSNFSMSQRRLSDARTPRTKTSSLRFDTPAFDAYFRMAITPPPKIDDFTNTTASTSFPSLSDSLPTSRASTREFSAHTKSYRKSTNQSNDDSQKIKTLSIASRDDGISHEDTGKRRISRNGSSVGTSILKQQSPSTTVTFKRKSRRTRQSKS